MDRKLVALAGIAFVATVGATAVLLTAVLPAAHANAAPRESAAQFVSRTVVSIVRDDYATAWATLYPGHQEVATEQEYVECELQTPIGWRVRAVTILRVADRTLRVPGDSEHVAAKAVTLRLRIANPSLGTQGIFTHTFTAVRVDSDWRWILTPGRYALYRDDGCTSAT